MLDSSRAKPDLWQGLDLLGGSSSVSKGLIIQTRAWPSLKEKMDFSVGRNVPEDLQGTSEGKDWPSEKPTLSSGPEGCRSEMGVYKFPDRKDHSSWFTSVTFASSSLNIHLEFFLKQCVVAVARGISFRGKYLGGSNKRPTEVSVLCLEWSVRSQWKVCLFKPFPLITSSICMGRENSSFMGCKLRPYSSPISNAVVRPGLGEKKKMTKRKKKMDWVKIVMCIRVE